MNHVETGSLAPVALITGGAQRIGASIARTLHTAGYNIVIHYRHSQTSAQSLIVELNTLRADTAICLQADLLDNTAIAQLVQHAIARWGRIDALINNASGFYSTPLAKATEQQWDELLGSNAKAPFFLAQALAKTLSENNGAIINIADIYADKPLGEHSIYCIAKAANVMLTKSLARDMAPHVRVNGIAPGAILWPNQGGANDTTAQQTLLEKIPLARTGTPQDIAQAILFLLRDAPYMTGQVITIDGGRTINT
ncbi:MAG TPA: pteridine reductase [Pseudomonadales bacterium]|nr:pteridine reductase [Pseudomonadales bacterium]